MERQCVAMTQRISVVLRDDKRPHFLSKEGAGNGAGPPPDLAQIGRLRGPGGPRMDDQRVEGSKVGMRTQDYERKRCIK